MLLFLSYVIANCCKKIPIPGMFLGMQYLERMNGLVLIMRKDSCLNITNNYSVIFCGNCQLQNIPFIFITWTRPNVSVVVCCLLQDTDISPAQRDEAVRWLTELHGRLQLYPETLVLAVSILDRFLAPIKVKLQISPVLL